MPERGLVCRPSLAPSCPNPLAQQGSGLLLQQGSRRGRGRKWEELGLRRLQEDDLRSAAPAVRWQAGVP